MKGKEKSKDEWKGGRMGGCEDEGQFVGGPMRDSYSTREP